MINILGVQIPIENIKLTPPKTEVILSYIQAIKDGKKEAEKKLKM